MDTLNLVKSLSTNTWKEFQEKWDEGESGHEPNSHGKLLKYDGKDSLYRHLMTYLKRLRLKFNTFGMQCLVNRLEFCRKIESPEGCDDLRMNQKWFDSGPALIQAVVQFLLGPGGMIRSIGLGELDEFNASLNKITAILWSNTFALNQKGTIKSLEFSIKMANQLLFERKHVNIMCNQSNVCQEYMENVDSLAVSLNLSISAAENLIPNGSSHEILFRRSLIDALTGALELQMTIYLPMLDPVEKRHLKAKYSDEDIDCLERLIFAYEHMGALMNYKNLAKSTIDTLKERLTRSRMDLMNFSKKLALRPVDGGDYVGLASEINHFLSSCCTPKGINDLLKAAKNVFHHSSQAEMVEILQRLGLWLSNASKFVHSLENKYGSYYQDFVAPVKYSVSLLQIGISGIYDIFKAMFNQNVSEASNNYFNSEFLSKLITFPCAWSFDIKNLNCPSDNKQNQIQWKFVQAKILEMQNNIVVAKEIDPKRFSDFRPLLEVAYKIWKTQEEMKRKKQAEEDSLYVTK